MAWRCEPTQRPGGPPFSGPTGGAQLTSAHGCVTGRAGAGPREGRARRPRSLERQHRARRARLPDRRVRDERPDQASARGGARRGRPGRGHRGRTVGEGLSQLLHADGAAGYGFAWLPADEALAGAVLEVSERPLVASNVDFSGASAASARTSSPCSSASSPRAPGSTSTSACSKARIPRTCCAAIFKALGAAIGQACRHDRKERSMSKQVVRTEAAPAPFQGAPYSRRSSRTGSCSSPASSALEPGRDGHRRRAGSGRRPSRCSRTCGRSSRRPDRRSTGSSRRRSSCTNLDDFAGMNEVYASHIGDTPPARSTVEIGAAAGRRAGRDRGDRARLSRSRVVKAIEDYVRSLGLDAYLVGGAVRDELARTGVEGRGLPRSRRRLAGLEGRARAARPRRGARRRRTARGYAPLPARPRDPGPRAGGHRVRAAAARAARPAPAATTSRSSSTRRRAWRTTSRRRDFTINAMARRLADGELVDPSRTVASISTRRMLRTVSRAELRGGSAADRARPAVRLAARSRPGRVRRSRR